MNLEKIRGTAANVIIPGWSEFKLLKDGETSGAKIAAFIDGFLVICLAVSQIAAKENPGASWAGPGLYAIGRMLLGVIVEDKLNQGKGKSE